MGWTDLQSQHLGCRNRSRSSLATQQVGSQPVSKQTPKHLQKPLHPTRYAGEGGTMHPWLSSYSWEHEWQTGIPTVPSPCFLSTSLAEDRDDWAVHADLLPQARRPLWWMARRFCFNLAEVTLVLCCWRGIWLPSLLLSPSTQLFSPLWAPSLSSPLTGISFRESWLILSWHQ